MVSVIAACIIRVTVDVQVGGGIIRVRGNFDGSHRYRLGRIYIVKHTQAVIFGFGYFKVIDIAIVIQIKVGDTV